MPKTGTRVAHYALCITVTIISIIFIIIYFIILSIKLLNIPRNSMYIGTCSTKILKLRCPLVRFRLVPVEYYSRTSTTVGWK